MFINLDLGEDSPMTCGKVIPLSKIASLSFGISVNGVH